MNIYILCGLPGSGKSTWSKDNCKDRHAIILSNDYFRTMLTGSYLFCEEHELFIHKCMKECLKTAIIDKRNVIYDEVNITKQSRIELISFVKELNPDYKITCVWLQESTHNINRRMNDSRGVPEHRWSAIIQEMKNKFEAPLIEEGFDEMIVI